MELSEAKKRVMALAGSDSYCIDICLWNNKTIFCVSIFRGTVLAFQRSGPILESIVYEAESRLCNNVIDQDEVIEHAQALIDS